MGPYCSGSLVQIQPRKHMLGRSFRSSNSPGNMIYGSCCPRRSLYPYTRDQSICRGRQIANRHPICRCGNQYHSSGCRQGVLALWPTADDACADSTQYIFKKNNRFRCALTAYLVAYPLMGWLFGSKTTHEKKKRWLGVYDILRCREKVLGNASEGVRDVSSCVLCSTYYLVPGTWLVLQCVHCQ